MRWIDEGTGWNGGVVVEDGEESGPVCGDAHLGGGFEMLDDGKKPRAPRDPPPFYFSVRVNTR